MGLLKLIGFGRKPVVRQTRLSQGKVKLHIGSRSLFFYDGDNLYTTSLSEIDLSDPDPLVCLKYIGSRISRADKSRFISYQEVRNSQFYTQLIKRLH